MALQRVASPPLASVSAGGSELLFLEALGFSDDGACLAVRATFRDDANQSSLRYAVWLYDVQRAVYLESLNETIASGLSLRPFEVDVSQVSLVGGLDSLNIIAQYKSNTSANADSALASLSRSASTPPRLTFEQTDLVSSLIGQGGNVPVAIERFFLGKGGRFLALQTASEMLSLSDVNGVSDVYLADLTTGSLSRVSILPGGAELSDPIALRGLRVDSGSLVVSLSTEGVLDTRDQNRSPQDPTRGTDAYVWTSSYSSTGLGVPSFTLLSVAGSGSSLQAQGGVDGVDYPELPISLSASGSFFTSSAEGLVEGDTNLSADVFFKATNGSTVQRVAFSTISQLSAGSRLIGASDSGALIAVLTTSPELGASVEAQQLVAVNTNSGQWSVVSKSSAGVPANNWVSKAVVSPLGTQIAFTTAADNLVGSSLPLASQGDLYIAPSGVDSNPTFKAMAQVNWWRSGAAMKGVTLLELGQAKSLVDANAPIQLKAARFDPGGSVAVEVWAKPPGALSKVAFQFRAPSDWQLGYVADTAFANWTKSQSSAGGVFSLQSEGASMVANSLIRLGTLTLIPPASNTALSADLQLSGASVNDLAAPGANLSFARGLSDTVGQWTAASLLADRYSLSVSRSVSDVGNAISSADALAALKIAVGLSPNPGSAPVTMGQFAAADVDRSNSVNSADALNVLKMAVGLSTAPARSFLWFDAGLSKQTVSGAASGFVWTELSSIDIPISGAAGLGIVGVLRGDVDGSWTPPIGG